MNYIDLHCDTLTECSDKGESLFENSLQASLQKLNESGCAAQCFAIFTQGEDAAGRFEKYLAFFESETQKHGVPLISCGADIKECLRAGRTGAILTVENLGFIGGDLSRIHALKPAGVKMASLVWNYENALARPNLLFENGVPLFERRVDTALTALGTQAAELLDEEKIMIDVSHLSDGGAERILKGRKIPVVASHSNAAAVCNVARNLTDGLIKKIAACGGVIGVNYCKDFLGDGATYEDILRHIKHIVNVGGEDVVALGSDFDGIPAPPELEDCSKIPALLEFLYGNLGARLMQKLCYENFTRAFTDVCG